MVTQESTNNSSDNSHEGRPVTPEELVRLGVWQLARLLCWRAQDDRLLRQRLRQQLEKAKHRVRGLPHPGQRAEETEPCLVGESPQMQRVFNLIRRFAATDAPVLITGETGTGKELAARAIHERSRFASGPFVTINCGGLPPTLIASELFGYEKGAFTGAYQRKLGRLEAANGGTALLDEIGDLPLDLQAHFLRFLQDSTIDRIGGQRPVKVDVRVIAATNHDLRTRLADGRFREDLFYRLNVLTLEMPPLRDRGDDIELLATFFLRKLGQEMGRPVLGFTSECLAALRAHPWPGNVREMISCVRRGLVMASGPEITPAELGLGLFQPPVVQPMDAIAPMANQSAAAGQSFTGHTPDLGRARRSLEATVIREALERNRHNVTRSAQQLGVSRVTLYRLMERYGLHRYNSRND